MTGSTEPKNPCKSCGGGWKPQSRREFLHNAVVAGASLAFTATALTAPMQAHAQAFDIADCLVAANDARETCLVNALQPAGNGLKNKAIRFTKRHACEAQFDLDVAACYTRLAAEVAKELGEYALAHPGEVVVGAVIALAVGTILVTAAGVVIL